MNCPKCNHNKNTVLDTRKDKNNIYRKRQCKECKNIWYTVESKSDEAKYKLHRTQYENYRKPSTKNQLKDLKIKLPDSDYRIIVTYNGEESVVCSVKFMNPSDVFLYLIQITSIPNNAISTISVSLERFEKDMWVCVAANHICSVSNDTIVHIVRHWLKDDCGVEYD